MRKYKKDIERDAKFFMNTYGYSALQAILKAIRQQLMNGNEVQLTNFGTFKPVIRARRTVPTPNGTRILPTKRVVRFTPGAKLRRSVG